MIMMMIIIMMMMVMTLLLNFFLNFDIYKLNIQIQISLMIGNLYLAGLITDNIFKK